MTSLSHRHHLFFFFFNGVAALFHSMISIRFVSSRSPPPSSSSFSPPRFLTPSFLPFLYCLLKSISMDVAEAVPVNQIADLSVHEQVCDGDGDLNKKIVCLVSSSSSCSENEGVCAICLDKISLPETALVQGCEHAYCVTCILRWATYNQNPSCPQCKHPFRFLSVHRSLDGRIHDYMFEESVCLLLRATWFIPLIVEPHEEACDDLEDVYYQYEDDDDDDDLDEVYFNRSSSVRIGNRRWGDNGYVRAGRIEARPVNREHLQDRDAGPSRGPKKKEAAKEATGRRAKRALKREAADKAAAAKHQSHLQRLGRM